MGKDKKFIAPKVLVRQCPGLKKSKNVIDFFPNDIEIILIILVNLSEQFLPARARDFRSKFVGQSVGRSITF